jgi:hypothetical protein
MKTLSTIGAIVTPAFIITDLHMISYTILIKSRGVNHDYLIQTLHNESNFGQRLTVNLKALAFIVKHLFIDKTTTW